MNAEQWRRSLPVLRGASVTLRELLDTDAPSLVRHLSSGLALQFVAAPPRSLGAFEQFICWTRAQRRAGAYVTFGIVPDGQVDAIGFVQIWPIEPDFSTAEWGFILGDSFWGTGVFRAAADLLLEFAFGTLGVVRLEARAVQADGRGNRALQKLGATPEGRLRCGFRSEDGTFDHVMWSLLSSEWRAQQPTRALAAAP